MDIYGVPSNTVDATVYVDNTPPSGSLAVFGAGHTYDVFAQNVSDPSGIKSVELSGGLLIPTFDVIDTVAPYEYVWSISSTFIIHTQLPFYIVVTDMFGNTMQKAVLCNVDTSTTRAVWLTCVPWR